MRTRRINWRRWLMAWAFSYALAFGQGSDTVYTAIASNTTTTGVQTQKPRQIGQSFHLLQVIADNVSASTCTGAGGWYGNIRLEGSFDNSYWQQIGQAITHIATVQIPNYITASGSFPYLRVNYQFGNTTNCKVTINYSGNTVGSLTSNTIPAVNDGYVYFYGLIIGPDTVGAMNMACDVGSRLTIYALQVMNAQGATSTPGDYIYVINSGSPGTPLWQYFIGGLANGTSISLPNGPRPYFMQATANSSTTNSALLYNVAAASRYVFSGVGRCE